MEEDLKIKMENSLKKNGKQPQKNKMEEDLKNKTKNGKRTLEDTLKKMKNDLKHN
jgi:hypothetical protein